MFQIEGTQSEKGTLVRRYVAKSLLMELLLISFGISAFTNLQMWQCLIQIRIILENFQTQHDSHQAFFFVFEQDKWRNMSIYPAGQGSKDKSRVARARPMAIDALVPSTAQNVTPIASAFEPSLAQSVPAITSAFENEAIDDPPKNSQEGLHLYALQLYC